MENVTFVPKMLSMQHFSFNNGSEFIFWKYFSHGNHTLDRTEGSFVVCAFIMNTNSMEISQKLQVFRYNSMKTVH